MGKQRGRNTNNKLPIGALIGFIAVGAVIGWGAVAAIVELIEHGNDFSFLGAMARGIADYRVWVIFSCMAGGIFIVFVVR